MFMFAAAAAAADKTGGRARKKRKPMSEEARAAAKLRREADTEFVSGKPKGVKNALKILNKVVRLEPDNHQNYYKRYRVRLRLKRLKQALADLEKAVEVKPDFHNGWVQQGKLLRKMGDCEGAERALQEALRLKPGHKASLKELEPAQVCAAHLRSAAGNERAGDYVAAEAELSAALESVSKSSDLLLRRASVRQHLGKWWEVLADAGKALKIEEGNLDALHMRAYAYYRLGDHEMALRHQREGLRLDPEHKRIKQAYRLLKKIEKGFSRAKAHSDAGRHAEAAEEFGSCAAIDPDHSEFNKKALTEQCRVLLKDLKNVAGARAACDRALQMDNDHLDAQVLRAKTFAADEDWEQCVREWQRAREIAGDGNREVNEGLQRAEAALKQSKEKDYYKILGVRRDASKREVKKAYRKLALEWHPDKHSGSEDDKRAAEKKFQEIAEAYEVLNDEEKRAKFDRGEPVFENQGGGGGGGGHHGFPFQHFQGGGGGGGGGRTFHFQFRL